MTTKKPISAIRLEDAYFCLSCEVVTNSASNCHVCGNKQMWPLENWIGRVSHDSGMEESACANTALPTPKPLKKISQLKSWLQQSRGVFE